MSSQESKSRSGRFDLPANELVEKFNATIPFEQRVCPFDIKDSQTHAAMLARQGIISEADAQAICRGLDQVAEEIRSGKFVFTVKDEDIHMAIEKRMTEIVGPAGGRLHTGRSRNDQTTTSTKMYLRHVIREVQEAIRGLQAECVAVARANAGRDHAGLHAHADRPADSLRALDDGVLLDARARFYAFWRPL